MFVCYCFVLFRCCCCYCCCFFVYSYIYLFFFSLGWDGTVALRIVLLFHKWARVNESKLPKVFLPITVVKFSVTALGELPWIGALTVAVGGGGGGEEVFICYSSFPLVQTVSFTKLRLLCRSQTCVALS